MMSIIDIDYQVVCILKLTHIFIYLLNEFNYSSLSLSQVTSSSQGHKEIVELRMFSLYI